MPRGRRVHPDSVKFRVAVLWLRGEMISFIARSAGLTENKARSIARAWCKKRGLDRYQAPQDARQAVLDELAAEVPDGGWLPAWAFRARPLSPGQRRIVNPKPLPRPASPGAGEARRDLTGAVMGTRERARHVLADKDKNTVQLVAGAASAPLERLMASGRLDDPCFSTDQERIAAAARAGTRRWEMATRLRSLFEDAGSVGVGAVDWLRLPSGQHSGLPMGYDGGYSARRDIERRRQFVPASDWAVLVALLQTETLDVMPGESRNDRKRLAAVCHRVRRALDYLALYDNQISRAEFLTLYPGASVRGGTR